MTTFELDLSKSESLIDDIQKIFKPPSVETSSSTKLFKNSSKNNEANGKDQVFASSKSGNDEIDNKLLKTWKKPKPNSHDFCDSCSTYEGERLVCDKCPASFHLECLDPPIDIDEAPVGVWYCNRCTAIMKDEDDKFSNASGNSTTKQDVNLSNGAVKHSSSSVSSEITTEMLEEIPNKKLRLTDQNQSKNNKQLIAMQNLIDVLQCINPKEFELPKHLIPGIRLPNSFKSALEMKIKSLITLENGVIPKPVVRCFNCTRTCFYGPLFQCDYCPLYYHLDCVDPPLVQLPSRYERWMCPNHVEHIIDDFPHVQSLLLSERIKAYEKVHSEMEQTTEMEIISDFINGKGLRFQNKLMDEENISRQTKVNVPGAVKRLYKQPLKSINQSKENTLANCNLAEDQKHLLTELFKKTQIHFDKFDDSQAVLNATLDSVKKLLKSAEQPLNKTEPIIQTKSGANNLKCRAMLTPLTQNDAVDTSKNPVRILYRNFTIGSSSSCDCVVSGCRYISPKHANINYVDNHFCYELINYSRYGTIVDQLIYYNDISHKDSYNILPAKLSSTINTTSNTAGGGVGAVVGGVTGTSHLSTTVQNVRNFLKSNGTNSKHHNHNNSINAMASQRDCEQRLSETTCKCDSYGYKSDSQNDCVEKGWENTAPLKIGSVIQVGCQRFLFGSVDHNEDSLNIHSIDSTQMKSEPDTQSEQLSDKSKETVATTPTDSSLTNTKSLNDNKTPRNELPSQTQTTLDTGDT